MLFDIYQKYELCIKQQLILGFGLHCSNIDV